MFSFIDRKIERLFISGALLALIMMLSSVTAMAGGEHSLYFDNNSQQSFPLSEHSFIYEDRAGNLTIEQITAPAFESEFKVSQKRLQFGYSASTYWIRFQTGNAKRFALNSRP